MAEKEATVYIVDVGASMGMKRNGRQETDLDWAMQYVWDKITSAVRPSASLTWNSGYLMPTGCNGAQDLGRWRDRLEDRW